jgi:hypothetical protein
VGEVPFAHRFLFTIDPTGVNMRRVTTRLSLLGLAAGCALLSASCEQGVRHEETGATLEGTINYGNEQVPFALVIVLGQGGSSTGKVGEDGRYKVVNAPLGEVKVAVNTEAGKGDFMTYSMAQSYQGPEAKGAKKANLRFVEVPKKYHDPETSGLTTTINKGPNTFDITIPK